MKTYSRPARNFAISFTGIVLAAFAVLFLVSALAACARGPATIGRGSSVSTVAMAKTGKKTMSAFGSEDELKKYFKKLMEERQREWTRRSKEAPAPMASANAASAPMKAL